jgi:hypothetical protein
MDVITTLYVTDDFISQLHFYRGTIWYIIRIIIAAIICFCSLFTVSREIEIMMLNTLCVFFISVVHCEDKKADEYNKHKFQMVGTMDTTVSWILEDTTLVTIQDRYIKISKFLTKKMRFVFYIQICLPAICIFTACTRISIQLCSCPKAPCNGIMVQPGYPSNQVRASNTEWFNTTGTG